MIELLIGIAAIGFSVFLAGMSIYRAWTIVNLDKEIIDDKKRKELIEPLKIMIFTSIGCAFVGLLSFILPWFPAKCICGVIPILICGNLLGSLWDELEKFDISLKEANEVKKFLDAAERDAIRKSK